MRLSCFIKNHLADSAVPVEPRWHDLPSLWKGAYMRPWSEPEDYGEQAFHISCIDVVDSRIDVWNREGAHIDIEQMSVITGTLSRSIEHPKSFTNQRDRWLRNSITLDLRHALKGRLPTEICQAIASYCTQERAAQIIRDLWPGRIRCKEIYMIPLDDQFPLWVSYVDIEGFRYVASVSRSRQSQSDELLFFPKDYSGSSFNIYFAEDSRGIRRIFIRESDAPPSIHCGAGLRRVICCLHQKLPLCLQWETDVSISLCKSAFLSHIIRASNYVALMSHPMRESHPTGT